MPGTCPHAHLLSEGAPPFLDGDVLLGISTSSMHTHTHTACTAIAHVNRTQKLNLINNRTQMVSRSHVYYTAVAVAVL